MCSIHSEFICNHAPKINIDKETVEEDRNKVKIQKSTPSSECKK